jgi:hypothetical protein
MTAIVEPISSVEQALPVCLFAENPYRLVSLLDMLRFKAHGFCQASGIIGQVYAQVKGGYAPRTESWTLVASQLGSLERDCKAFGLLTTLAQVERLKPIFCDQSTDNDPGLQEVARLLIEVQARLIDELASKLFLFIPAEKVRYYEQETAVALFGEDVANAFPSAEYDIVEVGKCYALNRSTACVFHLMRVLEIGLGVFAKQFSIPSDQPNWQNLIERIEKAVRDMATDPNRHTDWREQQEFFSQAASQFMTLKNAWRNYTAHARGKYTDEEAETIMINVRAFMQRLATRLHE